MANVLNLTYEFLEDHYEGELDPGQEAFYNRKVDQAVRLIFNTCKTLLQRYEAGKVELEAIEDIVADAVLRVVRNPDGMKKEAEGDYNYEVNQLVASGDIWYTQKNYDSVGCGGTQGRAPARTIRATATPGWAF